MDKGIEDVFGSDVGFSVTPVGKGVFVDSGGHGRIIGLAYNRDK